MVKKIGIGCFIAALTSLFVLSGFAEESIVELVQTVKPAVVTVITYDSSEKEGRQGSGFFIKSDEVITNRHVIRDAKSIRIKTNEGKTYKVSNVVAEDSTCDLAMLKTETVVPEARPLKMAAEYPKEGEKILVIGSAEGFESTVSDGIVSAIRSVAKIGKVIQITAPVSQGSSGSPVVNLKGEVIGVVVGYHESGQNINFAIPSERVVALKPGGAKSVASSEGAGPSSVKTMLRDGAELIRDDDYLGALKKFEAALKMDPGNFLTLGFIGTCHLAMQDYEKALDAFAKSVKINPEFADGYSGMGVALEGLGQPALALKAYKTAIKLEPENGFAHYALGVLYVGMGAKDSALDEYGVLKKINPELAEKLFVAIYKK